MRRKIYQALIAVGVIGVSFVRADVAHGKRAMTCTDLMAIKRVGEPVPSPDGKWVAFEAVDVNLDENTKRTHLWIVPSGGGDARRLNPGTDHDESRPRFSPDGRRLIFTSKAGDTPQVWITGFDANAGALTGTSRALTTLSTGASDAIWSPDGKNVVFVSSVYPDAKDDATNKERDDTLKKSKVKAQLFTHLFYRHWNAFTDFKRSHLFVVKADDNANAAPLDLTPGDHDVPPFSLGGQDMYAVSPDGKELAYTSNIDEVEATSTNNEIFIVSMTGGEPKKISTSPGSDSTPIYSPDGKWIAWRSQARAGFESDKESLIFCDRGTGQIRNATADFDYSVEDMAWEPGSAGIDFTVEDHGQTSICFVQSDPVRHQWETQPGGIIKTVDLPDLPTAKKIWSMHSHVDALAYAESENGLRMYFSRSSIFNPSEIAYIKGGRQTYLGPVGIPLTHINHDLITQLDLPPLESFTFKGAEDADVQGFLLRPPGFDPNKKYPLKFLIHGGPQGAWGDSWSFRWNPQLFAATGGYVVVMINPHGSTGYGKAFTDAVSGDWGGKPYDDLMKGLDYVEQTYPFIDKNREAALGASYGGYMINWMLGHTDRFKCLVSHDGLFNAVAAYGSTEELWFNEWEYRGTPWDNPETYRRWSPDQFAKNFKTPTLVVHGQLDYRLDVSQGFALFTTLQRLKVPSEMLYFPDEGHWVLKPQNSRLWNQTVNTWVDRWTASANH